MRVFLSYSTPDHDVADTLRRDLLALRPGLEIYFAPQRNDAGAYWIARLDDQLRDADAVLLLLGRRVGPWQELEYYEALRRNRDAGRPLIAPVLLVDTAPGLPFLDQFHRLGLEGRPFDDLVDRILQALDGADVGDATPPWRLVNPYRGLPAMEAQDSAFFFGREAMTGELLTRLGEQPQRLHALVGNSGVGKSSVAMAGVLAALKSRLWPGASGRRWPDVLERSPSWPVLRLRPGEQPVKALAQACAGLWLDSPAEVEREALQWHRLLMDGSSLSALVDAALAQVAARAGAEVPERAVLYVDQGEELYTRSARDEAARFSALLAQAVGRPNLVAMISLRSDHYGRFQADADLFRCAVTLDVTPLDRAGIERIVRLPAERLGVRFDPPELVGQVAAAAAREAGSLPLLSDLLADAWRAMARDPGSRGLLRVPFQGADIGRPLADKAERFVALHRAQEDRLRRLFTIKLALVPKEGDIVRRRARRSECDAAEWALVEALAEPDWRLLTTGAAGGEATAEVAHEALLRHWPRAARWLDESREFLIWKAQFEADHRAWQQAADADRDRALLTGLRLDAASRWLRERGDDLGAAQVAFITASRQAAAEALARERQATRRLARQRAWILRGSFAALVAVAVVAVAAVWQGRIAVRAERAAVVARDDARQQARLADARRLATAAGSLLDTRVAETTLAGLLAVESLRRAATLEGQQVLRRVLSLTPGDVRPIATPWPRSDLRFSPDGRRVAYWRSRGVEGAPVSGRLGIVDAGSWTVRALQAHEGRVWPVLSRDGRRLAVAGFGRRLQVLEPASQRVLLDAHQDDMFDAVFGADGRTLYVARTDGVIEVREAPGWQVARRLSYPLEGGRRRELRLAIGPDGGRLLVYGQLAETPSPHPQPGLHPWLVPVSGGAPIALGDRRAPVAHFGADGKTLVTADGTNRVSVRDARSGAERYMFSLPAVVSDLALTPDGATLVVARRDGKVELREAAGGALRQTLSHAKWVNAVALSADGLRLATASDDRTAAVWDLATGGRTLSVAHDDEVWSVAFGAGARTLLTGSADGVLQAVDATTGEVLHRQRVGQGIWAIVPDAASGVVALALNDSRDDQAWTDLVLADRASGAELARIEHNGHFSAVRFSPDGGRLATTTARSGALTLWDVATGAPEAVPDVSATELVFSADGTRLVASQASRETLILDAADGRRLATIGEPGGVDVAAFARDARTAVSFGRDGAFRGWDALTGAAVWRRDAGRPERGGVVLSGDGRRFAGWSADGKAVEVGETASGRMFEPIPADDRAGFVLSDDGRHLLLTRAGDLPSEGAARRPTTVEVWDVDGGRRVATHTVEHVVVRTLALPRGLWAVLAMRSRRGEPPGRVEILDAGTGARRWSVEVERGFAHVHRVSGRDDLLVLEADGTRQLRDASSGRVLFAVAGSGARASAAVPGQELIALVAERRAADGGDAVELRAIDGGRLRRRIDTSGRVFDLHVGADGRRLFVALQGERREGVGVWRVGDGALLRFIEMDNRPVQLALLADPDLIAVRDAGATLRVWQVSTGRERHRLSHTATADGVAVAARAERAVTWRGASLRVWDSRDGRQVAHRIAHGAVTRLSLSPDGRSVAYLTDRPRASRRGDDFKALVLWEPDTELDPVVVPMADPGDVRFGPAGRHLAVRQGSRFVQVLDAATLRSQATLAALPGGQFTGVDFSDDGRWLYVAESKEQAHALRVFEAGAETEVARIDRASTHLRVDGPRAVATVGPQGQWRASVPASATPDLTLWPVGARRLRIDRPGGRFVLRADRDPPAEPPPLLRDRVTVAPVVDGEPLNVWAVDAGARRLAAVAGDRITVHDALDGSELAAWPGIVLQGAGSFVGSHFRPIRGLVFADRGRALVAFDSRPTGPGGMAGRLWLWRWPAPPRLLSEPSRINMVAASPAADLFATAEGDRDRDPEGDGAAAPSRVRLWSATTGQVLRSIAMDEVVDAVAFSPDGARLAVRTASAVSLYRSDDATPVARFEFAGGRIAAGSVAFAMGGQRIVAEVADGIQSWSADGGTGDGRLLRTGSDFPYYTLSDDGHLLAAWDRESVRVFDVATAGLRFEMAFPRRHYRDFAFVGADHALVGQTDDGLDRLLWRSDRMIAQACARLTRDITAEEWRRFFGDEPFARVCPRDAQ